MTRTILEYLPWVWAVGMGGVFGGFYFGALWWTTRRIASFRHPLVVILGGFVARLTLLAGGYVWATDLRLDRTVLFLGGLLVARTVLVRSLGPDSACSLEGGGGGL